MPELSPVSVAFLVFPNVTQLDLTGPAQVLSRLGNVNIDLVWKTRDPVATDSGFPLLPTKTFDEVTKADILCVPGGLGTVAVMQDVGVLHWIRQIGASASWVTSVCTGSLILGAAGLLKGYRATSHWASHEQLALFGAEPVRQRVVIDRNRATGGGVTSGIDFGLELVSRIRGDAHAKFVQLSIEYDPHPPFNCGSPDTADPETLERCQSLVRAAAPDRMEVVRQIASDLGFDT